MSKLHALAEAYLVRLEQLAAKGGDLSRVAAVASLFVSRVDTAVDAALEQISRAISAPHPPLFCVRGAVGLGHCVCGGHSKARNSSAVS